MKKIAVLTGSLLLAGCVQYVQPGPYPVYTPAPVILPPPVVVAPRPVVIYNRPYYYRPYYNPYYRRCYYC